MGSAIPHMILWPLMLILSVCDIKLPLNAYCAGAVIMMQISKVVLLDQSDMSHADLSAKLYMTQGIRP